jgi:hypothetical protein
MRGLTPPEDRRGAFLAALELGVSPVVPGPILEAPVARETCGFQSPDPGDGYCFCTREPHGPDEGHACQHGGWD